jgi:peptidyl-prolyl cis-trans isomerase C
MAAKNTKKSKKSEPQGGSKAGIAAAVVILLALAAGGAWLTAKQNSVAATTDAAATENAAAPAAGDDAAKADAAGEKAGDESGETVKAALPEIKTGNPVVATIGEDEIKRGDVLNFIGTLPPDQVRQIPLEKLFPAALEQVVVNKIVTEKVGKAKLDSDPEVTQALANAKTQILRNVYLEREVNKRITEDKLKAAYKEVLKNLKPVEEVHAEHILVEDQKTAKEVISQLEKGADFAELSKKYSKGPSADKGGDLGWFAKGEMVPEFSDAAFELKKGEFTKAPVKTQFGWHIIKVEDRRMRPEPKYEDVKPQLEAQLRQKTLGEMVQGWEKDAKVKKFDINGEPIKSN